MNSGQHHPGVGLDPRLYAIEMIDSHIVAGLFVEYRGDGALINQSVNPVVNLMVAFLTQFKQMCSIGPIQFMSPASASCSIMSASSDVTLPSLFMSASSRYSPLAAILSTIMASAVVTKPSLLRSPRCSPYASL